MSIDVLTLKRANPIELVVQEVTGYELKGQRAHLQPRKGTKEGGLVVNVDTQLYFWNTKGEGGDVITFIQNEKTLDFRQACEWLAQRANIDLYIDAETATRMAATRKRQDIITAIMEWLRGKLVVQQEKGLWEWVVDSAAATYAEGRGWMPDTVAGCGFWDGDRAGLKKHCQMHEIDMRSQPIQALLKMPKGMFVYGHWEWGRCLYWSGRAIEGKGHWNPPRDLMGDRMPLWNRDSQKRGMYVVVVEGQADALTLQQWDMPAVALAGLNASEELIKRLKETDRVYIGLDSDGSASESIKDLAVELGPMCKITQWPNDGDEEHIIKDVNDWARYGGGSKEACDLVLGESPIYAAYLCKLARQAKPMEREAAEDRAVEMIGRMNEYEYSRHRSHLAATLGLKLTELDKMVKAKSSQGASTAKEMIIMHGGKIDGHLFEVIYDPNHANGPQTAFACRYPDGRLSITRCVVTEHYQIHPPEVDTIIERQVIKLPSKMADFGTTKDLLGDIQGFIHKYLDVPEDIEKLATYYVMMTWVYDAFYVIPYLRARGDWGSGKSRFTKVCGILAYKPIFITGSTTPSPVFRLMEMWNGLSVVMDEADLPHSETSSDWITMLNTGYQKGNSILRTNTAQSEFVVEAFNAYGPKFLNMRGEFADDATASRCITWETEKGRIIRDDVPRYMDIDEFEREALAIRNRLLKWRLRTLHEVEVDYNSDLIPRTLPGRYVEIMVSLMSISNDEEFKLEIKKFVDSMHAKSLIERQDTLEAKVLMGLIRAKFYPDEKALDQPDGLRLAIGNITRQTNRIIDAENSAGRVDDDEDGMGGKRKSLVPRVVGKILRVKLNLQVVRAKIGTRPFIVDYEQNEQRIDGLVASYGLLEYMGEMDLKNREREAKQKGDQGALNL